VGQSFVHKNDAVMIINGFKDLSALKSECFIRRFKAIQKTEFPENMLRNYTGCFDGACFIAFPDAVL
jgi:hypothetical protein